MANKSINYKIFDRDPILEHFKSDVLLRINDYKEKRICLRSAKNFLK